MTDIAGERGWSHWIRPRVLEARLARAAVPPREVAQFMLANLLLGAAVYYGAFTWANRPWTVLSLWECALDVIIIVYGMIGCFEAAGGDGNCAFAAQFSCLSFPIALWTTAIVWTVFWAGAWAYRQGLMRISLDDYQAMKNLASVGGGLEWLWTVAAVLGGQIFFFVWMRRSLARMRAAMT